MSITNKLALLEEKIDAGFKFYRGMTKYELEDGTTFWATNLKEAQKYKKHLKKEKTKYDSSYEPSTQKDLF